MIRFMEYLNSLQDKALPAARELFSKADTNNDGRLSEAEVLAMLEKVRCSVCLLSVPRFLRSVMCRLGRARGRAQAQWLSL